jgi:hypothetical protein
MQIVVLALAVALQAAPQDRYTVGGDLQAMYDELTQTMLSSVTPEDVDDFHTVFYTPDWTFTDRSGARHTWADLRENAVRTAGEQPYENARDVIRRISMRGDSEIAEVSSITVRMIPDADGKYGARGATHTIAEATPMRDTWLRTPTGWKLQAREQIGDPRTFVDKVPPEMDNPKPPVVKTS